MKKECKYEVGWHMGLILRHTEVHWKEKEAHGRYLEMALISVILRVTEHFISEFCEKNVVYSVNSRRGRGQEIIFFRQETELSADWRILL